MRRACASEVGARPSIDRMTSPALSGSVESRGVSRTSTPDFVPKYSPRSAFRSASRSPRGSPSKRKCRSPGPPSSIIGMRGKNSGPGRPGIGEVCIRHRRARPSSPRSCAITLVVRVSLSRRYSMLTVSPGSSLRASSTSFIAGPDSSSSSPLSPPRAVPLKRVMMSPALSPALSAGPSGVTETRWAPMRSRSLSAR
jgi:hypothetical protein